jgi:putative ABC transport system ATP-binding protein
MIVDLKNIHYSITDKNRQIEFKILNDIDLQLHKGECCFVYGPSGSGKTTLLHIIGALLHPSQGTRTLFSKQIDDSTSLDDILIVRNKIGYLMQSSYLPSEITVQKYLQIQASLTGLGLKTIEKRYQELLEFLSIDQFLKMKPSSLSGGERQRVALASVLLQNNQLLLLDEPTGSLDQKSKEVVWKLIDELRAKNFTILIVSHDLMYKNYSDRVFELRNGKLHQNKI